MLWQRLTSAQDLVCNEANQEQEDAEVKTTTHSRPDLPYRSWDVQWHLHASVVHRNFKVKEII